MDCARREPAPQRGRLSRSPPCARAGSSRGACRALRLLQQLARRVNVDGTPAAGLLAEAAAGALALVQRGHTPEVRRRLALLQAQSIEGADADAQLAAAADAVVFDHDRLRPLFAREGLALIADVVVDRLRRANHTAGAAVDAQRGVDHVNHVAHTGDRPRGATLRAGGATDAGFGNDVWQRGTSAGSRRPGLRRQYSAPVPPRTKPAEACAGCHRSPAQAMLRATGARGAEAGAGACPQMMSCWSATGGSPRSRSTGRRSSTPSPAR